MESYYIYQQSKLVSAASSSYYRAIRYIMYVCLYVQYAFSHSM